MKDIKKGQQTDEELPIEYQKLLRENKKFIEELALEDLKESRDTISSVMNRIKLEKNSTDIQKERFINEIKNGLGEVVRQRPNEIIVIKKPWHHKFTTVIKRIFSKI